MSFLTKLQTYSHVKNDYTPYEILYNFTHIWIHTHLISNVISLRDPSNIALAF